MTVSSYIERRSLQFVGGFFESSQLGKQTCETAQSAEIWPKFMSCQKSNQSFKCQTVVVPFFRRYLKLNAKFQPIYQKSYQIWILWGVTNIHTVSVGSNEETQHETTGLFVVSYYTDEEDQDLFIKLSRWLIFFIVIWQCWEKQSIYKPGKTAGSGQIHWPVPEGNPKHVKWHIQCTMMTAACSIG